MGIARSTFYAAPPAPKDDTAIVEAIAGVCDEFEFYGWRRVQAALRQQGVIVNHKKIKRLMREHGLQPKISRRHVATTDSDHDQPIFPNLAKDTVTDGPDQLWVADISYIAVAAGFVYVAVIMDAWSRRVVGYAISRSIDGKPPSGCVHHSDRGSQGGIKRSSQRACWPIGEVRQVPLRAFSI
jgi:putative transposase